MKRVKRKNYLTKMLPGQKLVARPSRWGNPFSLKDHSLKDSLTKYESWLQQKLIRDPRFLEPLVGFDLVCYCRLDQPCHADILLHYLENGYHFLNPNRNRR